MLTICIILIVLLALDLLFTLALRCRKGHRKWEVLKKYRYAHRGYHDKPVVPENSLPAFRRAIERGFGAELDVHLLKDGTLAVFHDSDLKRCANVEGEIEDLTLDELKQLRLEGTDEQIPTFDEVLALFEHETPLIIELKTARGNHMALAKAVCERLDSYQGEFCIESFDPFALIDVKKLRPEICRGQLSMNFEKDKAGLPWYKRFIAGNLLYYALGIGLAFQFQDNRAFCKYLCPVTVFLKPMSYFSLLRVHCDESKCVHCGKCLRACPMDVEVNREARKRKNGTECILCYECTKVCPTKALH